MKKLISICAIAALCMPFFTACDDDDSPSVSAVDVSEGVFIVCSGNMSNAIDGSLTYVNTTAGTSTTNAFYAANNRSLGLTANDALVYGSKLYIAVTNENTLEVVDRATLKSIKQISTTELMGADKGLNPRHLVAYAGKVYLSTFGTEASYPYDGTVQGYVVAIDTASYEATATYQVGTYPEGMAINNGKLYAACSSYGTGTAPSISEIDLSSGTVNEITDSLITNPVGIAAVNGVLYILDSGLYDASWNQSGQGVRKYENGKFTKLASATMMAVSGVGVTRSTEAGSPKIYMVNNPYTYPSTPVTYSVYDTATGETSEFIDGSDIYSPNGIGIDPITGNVYILSYKENPDTGYAGYSLPGYVVEYSSTGTKLNEYATGVGPCAVAVNSAVKYE